MSLVAILFSVQLFYLVICGFSIQVGCKCIACADSTSCICILYDDMCVTGVIAIDFGQSMFEIQYLNI